jgi:hypothetical protein
MGFFKAFLPAIGCGFLGAARLTAHHFFNAATICLAHRAVGLRQLTASIGVASPAGMATGSTLLLG